MTRKEKVVWVKEELRNRKEDLKKCDKEFDQLVDELQMLKEEGYRRYGKNVEENAGRVGDRCTGIHDNIQDLKCILRKLE